MDISSCSTLIYLNCSVNELSGNTSLLEFYCSGNPLTTLDISNNTALGWVYLRDMPTLYEVCVWETPFPPNNIPFVSIEGSPNVYFTTECSQ